MTARLIETLDDVEEGCAWLAAHEPRFAAAYALTGTPPLRRSPPGFATLLKAICSQQLSVASAAAVWRRLEEAGATEADAVLALDDTELLGCGLSRPKLGYARALAEARLDYAALAEMPEDEAVATLTAIKGIGAWTAEIYLMFAIGRADVFAHGDLALQEAARVLFDLDARPTEKPMRAMAEAWSPWRAAAARLLWAYYRVDKTREGVAV
ncbi:MAG: DNA-3-methyladenine glycosylase 2 family protein [Pseudomonadota bacterium]